MRYAYIESRYCKLGLRLDGAIHLCTALLVTLIFITTVSVVKADDAIQELRAGVTKTIQTVANKRKLAVDPAIVDEIQASVLIFAGNFCGSVNARTSQENCPETQLNNPLLLSSINEFLWSLEHHRDVITSVGEILANKRGHNFSQIGFNAFSKNNTAIIYFPKSAENSRVSLQTASGSAQISSSANLILLREGEHQISIALPDGNESTYSASIKPLQDMILDQLQKLKTNSGPAGRLNVPLELFCYTRANFGYTGPLAAFNWGRATFDTPGYAFRANITNRFGLDISVNDTTGQCGGRCSDALGIAFAQAIGVWRTGCERCDVNALSIIRVGRSIWIDARLANRLRQINSGKSVSLDLGNSVPNSSGLTESVAYVAAPSLSIPQMPVVGYEQVSPASELTTLICRLPNGGAKWMPAAKHLICGDSIQGTSIISPYIRILPRATSCGPSKDFIACGLPNAGIELSLDNVRYSLSGFSGTFYIGASSDELNVPLSDVILHEVGHWFGVPHFEVIGTNSGADIMASTLGDGKSCVSGASLVMLNNATDLRWRWRVEEGSGLRRPHSKVRPPVKPEVILQNPSSSR